MYSQSRLPIILKEEGHYCTPEHHVFFYNIDSVDKVLIFSWVDNFSEYALVCVNNTKPGNL